MYDRLLCEYRHGERTVRLYGKSIADNRDSDNPVRCDFKRISYRLLPEVGADKETGNGSDTGTKR